MQKEPKPPKIKKKREIQSDTQASDKIISYFFLAWGVDFFFCHSSHLDFFVLHFYHCSDQRNDFRNAVFGWRHGRGLHDGRWFRERRWQWWIFVFVFLLLLQENCHFVFCCSIDRLTTTTTKTTALFQSLKQTTLILIRRDVNSINILYFFFEKVI